MSSSFDQRNPYETPTEVGSPLPTGPNSDGNLAGRVNRLGAAIVDGIIAMVISLPIAFMTGYFGRVQSGGVSFLEMIAFSVFGLVVFMAVHGYLLATRGQTVGKMFAKIKIVDVETNQILPLGKLVGLRYVPIWIISIIPYAQMLNLIDILFIFRKDRRCVHDLIAGTKVVDIR